MADDQAKHDEVEARHARNLGLMPRRGLLAAGTGLALGAAVTTPAPAQTTRDAQEARNVAVVLRFFEDGWGANANWRQVWKEIMAPGVRHYFHAAAEPIVGVEENIAFNQGIFDGFPGIQVAVQDVIAEGDKVVVRARLDGVHGGEFLGVLATGRRVQVPDVIIFAVENDRIVEYRYMTDLLRVLATVGAIEGQIPAY